RKHPHKLLALTVKDLAVGSLQNFKAASAGRRILHRADRASTTFYEENIKPMINNEFLVLK
ncbi:hypothetical protein, partial [Stenotrophobium rhamnosiphilum]